MEAGKTIGKEVTRRLQIPCYDRKLIEMAVQKNGLVQDYIAQEGEYAPGKRLFSYAFLGRDAKGESLRDYVWKIQRQIILELVQQGPCVIVGRCAVIYRMIMRIHCISFCMPIQTLRREELLRNMAKPILTLKNACMTKITDML